MLARIALLLVASANIAIAQPADPYAPSKPAPNPYTPPAVEDPALDEQIAMALVKRARELYDARVYADAKQLAIEALAKSPSGAAAEQARFLVKSINQQLGIVDAAPQAPSGPPGIAPLPTAPPQAPVAPRSGTDPTPGPAIEATPERPTEPRASRWSSGIHAGLYFGLLGATVGAFTGENDDGSTDPSSPVLLGLVTGGVAAAYLPGQLAKLEWSDGRIRTMGSISVWTGVAGGLFGDIADTEQSNARQVLVGASIGATGGLLAGAALAQRDRYTAGDIALVDTLAGIGTVGGFTVGMLMQPAESEAYSLNAALGAAGGVVAGLIAAPQTNTTPRRMARVAGFAAAGGALPFLLYAATYDDTGDGDERLVGALSSAGLVAGAWLGFRLTAKLDIGLDVKPGSAKSSDDDAPISLVRRHSDGRWAIGALTVQPLSQRLAPQRGMTVPLFGSAF